MAVNIEDLLIELEELGTIVFCDVNSNQNFVVVMEYVSSDLSVMDEITNRYLSNDYQDNNQSTLINGVYKCEYSK